MENDQGHIGARKQYMHDHETFCCGRPEVKLFLGKTLSSVPINLHGCLATRVTENALLISLGDIWFPQWTQNKQEESDVWALYIRGCKIVYYRKIAPK